MDFDFIKLIEEYQGDMNKVRNRVETMISLYKQQINSLEQENEELTRQLFFIDNSSEEVYELEDN